MMDHGKDERPVKDLAALWEIRCKKVTQQSLVSSIKLAIPLLELDFSRHHFCRYEVHFHGVDAPEFLVNLKLLHGEAKVVAFWFSEETELNVNAWKISYDALCGIWYKANEAISMQRKLARTQAPFNAPCRIAKIDLINYTDLIRADLAAITKAAKRELKSCLL